MAEAMPTPPSRPRGGYWAYVPVAMIVAMLAGLGTMAKIATNDPSFAVEKNYYQKAVSWDAEMAQQAENARLGWQTELSVDGSRVSVELRDRDGKPIDGAEISLEAFHNARAAHVLTAKLSGQGGGRYESLLPLRRAGLWEFRMAVQAGNERVTATVRKELFPP